MVAILSRSECLKGLKEAIFHVYKWLVVGSSGGGSICKYILRLFSIQSNNHKNKTNFENKNKNHSTGLLYSDILTIYANNL